MAPVFTEQIRIQQELAEQRRREEALQKESVHRAKQTTLVYVWTEVCECSAFLFNLTKFSI